MRELALVCFVLLIASTTAQLTICKVCKCGEEIIDCQNRNIQNLFQREDYSDLKNISQYRSLYLDSNRIAKITIFPQLEIERLSLCHNSILKIDIQAFINLKNLKELDLSHNELLSENLKPDAFQGPYDPEYYEPLPLENLDLSSNELHTLAHDLFEHLPHIKRLYLRSNPFKKIDKQTTIAISSLSALEFLDLSYTDIKELPSGFLHTPRHLYELDLSANYFLEVPADVLADSHGLGILYLNDNPIQAITIDKPFPPMPTLKQLHISFMPNLTRIERHSLAGLTNLELLDCRKNARLEFISPEALVTNSSYKIWPPLKKLNLNDNAIRYLGFNLLGPDWNKLKHINILGNDWSCDCENQWIVSALVPLLHSINSSTEGLICQQPIQMKGIKMQDLTERNYTLRCLDMYGNHPEHDGTLMVTAFVIVILLLVTALVVILYKKHLTTACRRGGPVNYSRAFYTPAESDDHGKF